MITRKDIERVLLTLPPTLTGKEVRRLFGEILKERDEVFARNKILEESKTTKEMLDDVKKLFEEMKESRNAAEARTEAMKGLAESYREQAIHLKIDSYESKNHSRVDCIIEIDAEAQRIIAEKK